MNPRANRRRDYCRIALSAAALCAVVGAGGAAASAEECSLHYPFGNIVLAESNYQAGHYGADLRLLYGDWEWGPTFGLQVDVMKAARYVEDVAGLVRHCIGDFRRGRLSFSRRQVLDDGTQAPRDETDAEYFARIFDELVAVRREFALIENNYEALVHEHAPLVPPGAFNSLKNIASETLLRMMERAADRATGIGWVLVQMQELEDALERFLSAHEQTRELIEVFLRQHPSIRDIVIDDLTNNTESVLDQYGAFFSPERRAALEALLQAAAEQTEEEDIEALIVNLNEIADEVQTRLMGVWQAGEPLIAMASKLEFIFGDCDSAAAHRLASDEFFGDLPVAERIVQEGDDASLCAQ